ncbi:stringent starvation protein B [Caulobacter sp. CCUG 60055]|uniref:SspB family protein n=1 Tax=Caulobacter sp. CCUG 60055 TaxID=2100090 RepID=UPI001FA786C5|nr:SspB family protein [Caulobacter sp. CCUG 60055]MCI3180268.1 stringent starvation protein B [Caulobacter sp. CCUG 60055]
MAQEQPPEDLMHYEAMAQDALRGVVKAALKRAASEGIPGDHHFYITFRTGAPGVSGPPELLSKYPDEMTIVLQHQYWDLTPGDTFFSVLLKFGGQPKKLSVPYAALTRFYDPSVQFLLQFDAPEIDLEEIDEDDASDDEAAAAAAPASGGGDDQPKVVSLDQFRKK